MLAKHKVLRSYANAVRVQACHGESGNPLRMFERLKSVPSVGWGPRQRARWELTAGLRFQVSFARAGCRTYFITDITAVLLILIHSHPCTLRSKEEGRYAHTESHADTCTPRPI